MASGDLLTRTEASASDVVSTALMYLLKDPSGTPEDLKVTLAQLRDNYLRPTGEGKIYFRNNIVEQTGISANTWTQLTLFADATVNADGAISSGCTPDHENNKITLEKNGIWDLWFIGSWALALDELTATTFEMQIAVDGTRDAESSNYCSVQAVELKPVFCHSRVSVTSQPKDATVEFFQVNGSQDIMPFQGALIAKYARQAS